MWVLAITAAALAVLSIVLLVLWLLAKRAEKKAHDAVFDAEQEHLASETALRGFIERSRVVRELSRSSIVQLKELVDRAEGAKLATAQDTDGFANRSFTYLQTSLKELSQDTRRVFDVARTGDSWVSAEEEQPTEVADLLELYRKAGLTIHSEEKGEAFRLRPGAEVARYRLIQEAVRNSLQHGGIGTEVWVTQIWSGDDLKISVDDDGLKNQERLREKKAIKRKVSKPRTEKEGAFIHHTDGPGIQRMKSWVELFNGFLDTHERSGVGFSVSANLTAVRSGISEV